MKKIAIIGAGFAGLATAWHLLNQEKADVTLFDAHGVGGGASGIAAGLMHPYAGLHAKRSQDADEGMAATKTLLDIASKQLQRQIYKEEGLLRLAITAKQRECFYEASNQYEDVEWLEPDQCEKILLQPCSYPGILIRSAIVVDCPSYLEGLFLACKEKGMEFIQKKIETLSELKKYDAIILTMGAHLLSELSHLSVHPVKGQVLKIKWPEQLPKPPIPLSTQAYFIPDQGLIGATFEHNFANALPDIEFAKRDLLPKIQSIYPMLNEEIECRSALRASTPNRKPLIKQVGEKCWIYTGLASKGLLYHSLYAKNFVDTLSV